MPSNQSTGWKFVRHIFDKVHLYAGLTSGLIVVAVCLSGTIYVYNTEIRETADSELYFVEESGGRKSADELSQQLEESEDSRVTAVSWNDDPGRSVQFTMKKEGEEGRGTTFFVNPYSGEILGNTADKTAAAEFMGYMFSLHRWLLLDKIEEPILDSMSNMELGRFINGVATLLFLLGVVTGIVIWFPQKVKSWKQGLKIKWSANWKRVNHDLHNTLAFYSLIFLFIMGATGPFWSFVWYKEGYQKLFDTYQAPNPQGRGETRAPKGADRGAEAPQETVAMAVFSIDDIIRQADISLPYAGVTRVTIPDKPSAPISVSKSRTGFFARAGADQLTISPDKLEVTEAKLFSDLPLRQQIGRSVKSLHTGEIYGQLSKFIWFLACLVATSLPITGTLIWWNKRKKKKISRRGQKRPRVAEMA